MKNCDEMVNSLLERRERYAAEQKKKRMVITRTVTSMCCVCLIALLGFGMWQGGVFNTTTPNQTLEDALYPGIKDNFDEKNGESADNPDANNKIVVNSIENISSARLKMNICLFVDDFVEMTREEMITYYGVDYFPNVPADIKPWEENERSGIYKRGGGIGDVYWDADILNYSNENFTRNVHLEVDKESNVLQDCFYFKGTEEKSIINNVEVLICLSENGYYYAEFMYNGAGFLIHANGVTQDEFVAIITSVLD